MELKEELIVERKQLVVLKERYRAMLSYYEARLRELDTVLDA
jgi:hypothetical protein